MNEIIDEVNYSEDDIAIIGMSLRLPGANSVKQFWENLCEGEESITFFSNEELRSAGIAENDLNNPNYVKANAILDNVDNFDADFFGFSPREAEVMDPQHRLFLKCSWEVLEDAGYNPEKYPGRIGVIGGAGFNTYLFNLFSNPRALDSLGYFQVMMMNSSDHLTSIVSYKLNLTGPALTVQTACSTSLVATHLACQSLLQGESDMVIAGGASLTIPQKIGYLFQEGGIVSPDGHCRAFDSKSNGTVGASGVAVVLLKRLNDALIEGDKIYSVIKGSAINNDGSLKIGYTAPSQEKQAEVIMEALEISGTSPDQISFVEAHGTGTKLGDPIEINALTKAYRQFTNERNYCAIGSVKTNIGHTDTVAGIAGLIKTSLSLYYKKLPQSLHYDSPNPEIDFTESPFFVNTKLLDLSKSETQLKAGVSSFGLGGTNVHAILAEPPRIESEDSIRKWHLLPLSAQQIKTLNSMTKVVGEKLAAAEDINIADVTNTLQNGRKIFRCKRFTICKDTKHASKLLIDLNPQEVFSAIQDSTNRSVAFLFPGMGFQYPRMGIGLLKTDETFRETFSTVKEIFFELSGENFFNVIDDETLDESTATEKMQEPAYIMATIFAFEYALAKTLEKFDIFPQAMLGHSFGEYTAACLAEVFSLEDIIKLIIYRAKLLNATLPGAMLSVTGGEEEVIPLLNENVSLAVVNTEQLLTLSGTVEAIDEIHKKLVEADIQSKKILVKNALHSHLMEPIMQPFEDYVAKLKPKFPQKRYISCITGDWIKDSEVTSPVYWSGHLRNTVRFKDSLNTFFKDQEIVPLEVGPGRGLEMFARQNPNRANGQIPISLTRHPKENKDDDYIFLQAIGRLWMAGVNVKWNQMYEGENRHRISLPTYPFEEKRYWIDANTALNNASNKVRFNQKLSLDDWFYLPTWKESLSRIPIEQEKTVEEKNNWLVFCDESRICNTFLKKLQKQNEKFTQVYIGSEFSRLSENGFEIDINSQEDYIKLIETLKNEGNHFSKIIHFWNLGNGTKQTNLLTNENFDNWQWKGYYSLLFLTQAFIKNGITDEIRIMTVANNQHDFFDSSQLNPAKATLLGANLVIGQEHQNFYCKAVDIKIPKLKHQTNALAEQLLNEIDLEKGAKNIVLRNGKRYVNCYEKINLPKRSDSIFKEKGVYILIGGLGRVTGVLGKYLVSNHQAKIAFIGRTELPDKKDWDDILKQNMTTDKVLNYIRKIREIENFGCEVLYIKADIADENALSKAIELTEKKLGKINGIIQAAGAFENKDVISSVLETSVEQSQKHFKSKVYGTNNLFKVLQNKQIDFCMLMSSNTSILGGLGMTAYSAANCYLDAVAKFYSSFSTTKWISANWDGWGIDNVELSPNFQTSADAFVMEEKESSDAFERIINNTLSEQIVVSTGDLEERLNIFVRRKFLEDQKSEEATNKYDRSETDSEYIEPENDLEKFIVDIWQDLLGIDQIGRKDNFFELGGHSLIAPKFATKVFEDLKLKIPLESIFIKPTVMEMAEFMEELILTEAEKDNLHQAVKV